MAPRWYPPAAALARMPSRRAGSAALMASVAIGHWGTSTSEKREPALRKPMGKEGER